MNKLEITSEMKKSASEKMYRMPLGTYSRLRINGEVSDIIISVVSSGVYFYNVPGIMMENISDKIIGFKYYSEVES